MTQHLALITKTQSLIAAGDIVGAESALAELADTEGDRALVVVLDQLPPKDVLAVIREFDTSKESVVNLVITPEQFARAVVTCFALAAVCVTMAGSTEMPQFGLAFLSVSSENGSSPSSTV